MHTQPLPAGPSQPHPNQQQIRWPWDPLTWLGCCIEGQRRRGIGRASPHSACGNNSHTCKHQVLSGANWIHRQRDTQHRTCASGGGGGSYAALVNTQPGQSTAGPSHLVLGCR